MTFTFIAGRAKGNNALFLFSDFCIVGVAIEAVSDSSRYFVIRVVDDNGNFVHENERKHFFFQFFTSQLKIQMAIAICIDCVISTKVNDCRNAFPKVFTDNTINFQFCFELFLKTNKHDT